MSYPPLNLPPPTLLLLALLLAVALTLPPLFLGLLRTSEQLLNLPASSPTLPLLPFPLPRP